MDGATRASLRLIAVLALLAGDAVSRAAPPSSSGPAAPAVTGATSTVPASASLALDGRRSRALFLVSLRPGTVVEGRLSKLRGDLSGSAQAGWRVRVRLDGRSLRLRGPSWMQRMTRSDAFLAVDRHPDIGFESDRFDDALLHAGGELPGQLTLRGLTRPVSLLLLPSACARPGQDCELHVQGSLSRKAFGMTAYRALVRDPVQVRLRVRLRAPAATP